MASRSEGNTSIIEPVGDSGTEGKYLIDNLQSTSQKKMIVEHRRNIGQGK